MQHSLFLSSTSLALVTLATLGALSACGDDTCGPGDAPDFGILASSADVTLNFGNLTSGPNRDCPDSDAPSGVTSLTIQGVQLDGLGLLTLCIPRPDKLQHAPLPLGAADGVLIIDLNGTVDGCTYYYEALRPVTGDVRVTGMCDNGQTTAGYAITIDGSLSLRRMCMTMNDTIAVTFAGTVAVEGGP